VRLCALFHPRDGVGLVGSFTFLPPFPWKRIAGVRWLGGSRHDACFRQERSADSPDSVFTDLIVLSFAAVRGKERKDKKFTPEQRT